MSSKPLTIDQVLALLAATPERIAALADGLSPAQLRASPGDGEWSVNDVLAHLRSCADMWGGSIERMLAEDHPTLRAIDPRTWMTQTDYPDLDFTPSMLAFTQQRAELLALLKPLPEEGYSRGATFTGAGKPLERTVRSQAQRLVVHERPHLKQIERIVKTMTVE